jgi:Clp amino terminal domain, pathogenicity island component
MMFERFTDGSRQVIVQAQKEARRLGHNYIGCEHLLLAVAGVSESAADVLRDQGVTPERVEAEIVRIIGRGPAGPAGPADPLSGLDREALAAIGIDLDVVRARLEAAFGPGALDRAVLAHKRGGQAVRPRRHPALGKGPVARLMHLRRVRSAHRAAFAGRVPLAGHRRLPPDPPPRHIPFTPRAKKSLELSLREAKALHDDYIGVQHLILAQLAMSDGMTPTILSALGASRDSLRAAILARYRKAS